MPRTKGPILRIATVHIETTGLDAEAHELIEISMQWVDVSFVTGRVVAIGPHYADRESPSRPLSRRRGRSWASRTMR